MKSHFSLNNRAVVACALAGASTMMMNRNCTAQTVIAADYATNSIYAAGWSAGQNGGHGFGPWSLDNTSTSSPQNAMDPTSPNPGSPYDPFGVAWTLYNPVAPAVGSPNPPDTGTASAGDISRAGRAIPNGGLQVGQTFSTIISNPSERKFYRGYTIVLSNGGDNIAYGGAGTALAVGTFDYAVPGGWYTSETFSSGGTGIFDTDTTTNGMEIDVTLTDTNSYHLVMTPLGNPAIAYSEDGTFDPTNSPINWVTYQLYNTDSDWYNFANGIYSPCANPQRTDFYIQGMTITGPPPFVLNIQKVGANVILTWPTNYPTAFVESTSNLGPTTVWNTNSIVPVIINDQTVVTNPIAGAQQYYRLHQ
ncbi:MAG TPA: hypothetical protein VNZ25_07965 [Candidatus Angelobacter sp.]|jgi:hypothetical protein|nr:hypothetical protein [Candidatus Angelobacter sp.]